VICRLRRESIDVGTCRDCTHCDAVTPEPAASVDCTITLPPQELTPDPLGERTEVGTLLRGETTAIASSASLRDALELLRARDLRSVAVVGGGHILVGLLYEVSLTQRCAKPGAADTDVRNVMSSPLAIHESTPVRQAIRFLAAAHLRQAPVVTTAGVPLGMFRDVEGLRWLTRARTAVP
jgi:CBS domain-containing protein